MARLGQAVRGGGRGTAVHAAGAGYRHRRPPDRDAVPVHADRYRPDRTEQMGADRAESDWETAAGHRSGQRPAIRWAAAHFGDQPGYGGAPRHHGITDRRGAVRCLRPAPDRAALYQPEPVFRHHGGKSRLPTRPGWAATDLCPFADRRHGAAERTGHASSRR